MNVIDVKAMVMEVTHIVIGLSFYTCDRREGDGDGIDCHCFMIKAVIDVIDVMVMVMDVLIGLKL